ncbi:cell adhesion molecule CEACAM5-like [Menidia menidia]
MKNDKMETAMIYFTVFGVFGGVTEGIGVLPDGPLKAALGGTVMFKTDLSPTETPFSVVLWNFDDGDRISIVNSQPTSNLTGGAYEGRITLFISTGSLELRNVRLTDSGEYIVTIIPVGAVQQQGETRLDVYEPVSAVTVTSSSADLVEFSGSVRLSCSSSSGSSLSFLWMNGSSEVTASDRVQLTDGGSNLTIINVTRYDHGSYRCNVSNPVSTEISGPANLFISYGPENIKLSVLPPKEHHQVGSDITLSCSADSRPNSTFQWFLNAVKLPDTGPELRLMKIQMSQSGNYSCQASNHKTLRNQTSQPLFVSVLERISNASMIPSLATPVEGTNVSLSCEASGSIFNRTWKKDGSYLTSTENITLSEEDSVLTFMSVNRNDTGTYFCTISNPISASEVSYTVKVNYGPENVKIKAQDTIPVHEPFELTCSADSVPSATYTWLLNGTETSTKSHKFSKNKAEFSDSGNYTCNAWNEITKRKSSDTHQLLVKAKDARLSPGAIAGIVIACLVILVAAGGGVYFYKKNGKKSSNSNTVITTGNEPVYENNGEFN